MKTTKLKTLSMAALIISAFPLTTLIPVFLKIVLPEGLSMAWAGMNIVCVLIGLFLSIVCVKNNESRSVVSIISTVISTLLALMILGIVILALYMTYIL